MPRSSHCARYRVRFYLTGDQNPAELSHVISGLAALHSRKLLTLTLGVPPRGDGGLWGKAGLAAMAVTCPETGKTTSIAIDLHDRSDVFGSELLERCDVYLKRSYYPPDVESLAKTFQAKVVPFGLNYACRTAKSTVWTVATLGLTYTMRFLRALSRGRAALEEEVGIYFNYLATPNAVDFECGPDVGLEPTVLFQTRVWEPEPSAEDFGPLNETRVALVRALREEFGRQFVGGIVPTAYAMRYCPDVITKNPCRHGRYLAFSKKSLVAVCSRGLHHSLPFKLPEYLAGSKCIVSDQLRNTLPVPLVAGSHYLQFSTVDECVRQCLEVFHRPELARELRGESWAYYREEVAPDVHMANCIERAVRWISRTAGTSAPWHAANGGRVA